MHAPEARSLYLPLIRRDVGPLAWHKGAGQGIQYLQHSFVYGLGVTWWYDWQHDYAWFVTGRIAEPSYKPMVWCPHLPGEPGPTPDYYTDAQKGLWNPQELAAKARQYPGRTWLIFNEPDFPPSIHPGTPTPSYSFQQCGRVLCEVANYATPPVQATLPPNVTPTPTATWTPTPTLPPGTTATPLPTPLWPCSWPATTPIPDYYSQLRAKMIRIAADRYAQIYRIIKANDPTAKVFCCGNLDAGYSQWWADFLQQLRLYHSDVRIDGVAIHAYPWNTSVRNCWNYEPESEIWVRCMQPELEKNRNDFRSIGAPLVPDAPLWITETGYLGIPTEVSPPLTAQEVRQYVMDPMVVWLQSGNAGYQAVAWFISIGADPPQTNLFLPTAPQHTPSAMTILGARWATVTPALAP